MDSGTLKLNDAEARVLGVLIEKSMSTPDGYPLSLNALLNGCNQKSNRHPVTSFVEAEVVVALQGLVPKGLAGRVMGAGSRVEKFRHNANHVLKLDDGGLAILAELLLRGPQAPGGLRARVHRLAPTPTLDDLRVRLDALLEAGYVARAAPAPGSRAERFVQLLAPNLHSLAEAEVLAAGPAAATGTAARLPLEARVQQLESKVEEMSAKLDDLLSQLGG